MASYPRLDRLPSASLGDELGRVLDGRHDLGQVGLLKVGNPKGTMTD